MSNFMFLGVKDKLKKIEYGVKDIYDVPEIYKNDLWFSDGLLFDEDVIEQSKNILKSINKDYYWYEIKGFLTPLSATVRSKSDAPDLYEASVQMSQWFCKFVKNLKANGNDILSVKLWIGPERKLKYEKQKLNISKLDLTSYTMPLEVICELDC